MPIGTSASAGIASSKWLKANNDMKKAKRKSTSPKSIRAVDKYIGKRMRERRRALHMGQTEVASILGVSFQQIQKYEKGLNRVSAARLFDICKVLNVSLSSMFERDPTA
jgi:DNA-binding XRE family transcriptional regulator